MVSAFDIFVLVSGTISVVSTAPLLFLAWRSHAQAATLRLLQHELMELLQRSAETAEEIRELQRELESRQRETAARVEDVRTLVERRAAGGPDLLGMLSTASSS